MGKDSLLYFLFECCDTKHLRIGTMESITFPRNFQAKSQKEKLTFFNATGAVLPYLLFQNPSRSFFSFFHDVTKNKNYCINFLSFEKVNKVEQHQWR